MNSKAQKNAEVFFATHPDAVVVYASIEGELFLQPAEDLAAIKRNASDDVEEEEPIKVVVPKL